MSRCAAVKDGFQCALVQHDESTRHCAAGKYGWIFWGGKCTRCGAPFDPNAPDHTCPALEATATIADLRAQLDEAKDERDKFAELLQSAPYSQRLLLDDRARMLADVAREKERAARWKACAKRWRKRASETLALLGRGIEIFDGDDKRVKELESALTALRVAHEVSCCERDQARMERDSVEVERHVLRDACAGAADWIVDLDPDGPLCRMLRAALESTKTRRQP